VEVYGVNDAAEYVGLSESTIRYHVYVTEMLVPDRKISGALIFSKETLDHFQEQRQPGGRPREEGDGNMLSAQEAADALGIKRHTVYGLLQTGKLSGKKRKGVCGAWRVRKSEVERYLREGTA